MGSFLNVLTLRLPLGKSIKGRSECVACHKQLKSYHLIPLLSYVFLRGKCAWCHVRISARYFIFEFVTGIIFALGAYVYPVSLSDLNLLDVINLLRVWLVLSIALLVFVIDYEHFLILTEIVYPGALALLILNLIIDLASNVPIMSFEGMFAGGVLSSFALSGCLYLIWLFSKGEWMGFGDVRFMWFFGLALGFPFAFFGFGLASIIGTVVGLGLVLLKGYKLQSRLPFGVFLSVAMAVTLLWGPKIWDSYITWVHGWML